MELSIDEKREHLSGALMSDDVEKALWHLVNTGLADEIVPELPALRLCLLYTSPSPRDATLSRMPSSA